MSRKAASEALSNYWQQHIDRWQVSGQSQQEFCKLHDLSYHRFLYWRRKFEGRTTENLTRFAHHKNGKRLFFMA